MCYLVCWYQNQQDPQPRERDYFYVGAFYVYAMWIGIGATGILETIRARFGSREGAEELPRYGKKDNVPLLAGAGNTGMLAGAFALLVILAPINMCVGLAGMAMGKPFSQTSKWAEYSRHNNYIPYDYAYNILQSCDKD